MRPFPKCATKKQIQIWSLDRGALDGVAGFCEDCLPDYQKDMIWEGKCDNPDVIFDIDEDGFVYGKYPTRHNVSKEEKRKRQREEYWKYIERNRNAK